MIQIRNETGVRSRRDLPPHTLTPPDWVRLAVLCASLQARSLIESGKKKIRISSAKEIAPELDLLYLYEVGLVEPIVWDEHDRTRKLLKIRSADLSLQAAQGLVTIGLLPRCFLPVLMSKDLLASETLCLMISDDELVIEEFAAWIECGGLSDDQTTMQQALGANDAEIGSKPAEFADLPTAQCRSRHHTSGGNLVAGLNKPLGSSPCSGSASGTFGLQPNV